MSKDPSGEVNLNTTTTVTKVNLNDLGQSTDEVQITELRNTVDSLKKDIGKVTNDIISTALINKNKQKQQNNKSSLTASDRI